jgi:phosphoglucomutase
MQKSIAAKAGIKMIETLTGFKWIGAKIEQYQKTLRLKLEKSGIAFETYLKASPKEKLKYELDYSQSYLFGSEESYGSLALDQIRDKDGAGACLLMADLLSYLKKENKTILSYLESLYLEHGYFAEDLLNLNYEGAKGITTIQKILYFYNNTPPDTIGGLKVINYQNFEKNTLFDEDHQPLPKESFYYFTLENDQAIAVRASGTEPKIKFYLFANCPLRDIHDLSAIKKITHDRLNHLKNSLIDFIKNYV